MIIIIIGNSDMLHGPESERCDSTANIQMNNLCNTEGSVGVGERLMAPTDSLQPQLCLTAIADSSWGCRARPCGRMRLAATCYGLSASCGLYEDLVGSLKPSLHYNTFFAESVFALWYHPKPVYHDRPDVKRKMD